MQVLDYMLQVNMKDITIFHVHSEWWKGNERPLVTTGTSIAINPEWTTATVFVSEWSAKESTSQYIWPAWRLRAKNSHNNDSEQGHQVERKHFPKFYTALLNLRRTQLLLSN